VGSRSTRALSRSKMSRSSISARSWPSKRAASSAESRALRDALLCAHPAADRWTPPALSRPFFDRITGPKRWVDLEGCGHFPVEAPGAAALLEGFDGLLRDLGV